MTLITENLLTGNYCVVVSTRGTAEVNQISNAEDVFLEAKGLIGCRFLDHVRVQEVIKDMVNIEFLVNDEGYSQLGNDHSKVNQIATFFYNGGEKPDHYILKLAETIVNEINNNIIKKAKEICPVPEVVPDPTLKITSFNSAEDMVRALNGDKSVKPVSEKIISGQKPNAEKEV